MTLCNTNLQNDRPAALNFKYGRSSLTNIVLNCLNGVTFACNNDDKLSIISRAYNVYGHHWNFIRRRNSIALFKGLAFCRAVVCLTNLLKNNLINCRRVTRGRLQNGTPYLTPDRATCSIIIGIDYCSKNVNNTTVFNITGYLLTCFRNWQLIVFTKAQVYCKL